MRNFVALIFIPVCAGCRAGVEIIMKLTIENGTLKACVLNENEKTVILPESVRKIDDYAFSQVPPGQIRHLFLPDGIENISFYAFSNLGKLASLTAYTYEIDINHVCWDGIELIQTDTLILLPGESGDFFMLPAKAPKKLVMERSADIRPSYRDPCEHTDFEIDTETLIIYNMGTSGFDVPWIEPDILRCMSNHLKKLHFMNNVIWNREDEYHTWEYMANRIPPSARNELEHGYDWLPVMITNSITEMHALEEVILPEGLTEVKRYAFAGCESLRKVVFPVSLKKIGDGAFEGCHKLKTVLFCKDTRAVIGQNAFVGCDSLRTVSFYENSGSGRMKKKTSSESATSFLSCKCLPLTRLQLLLLEYWNMLSEEQQQIMFNFILRHVRDYEFFGDTSLSKQFEQSVQGYMKKL